MDLRDHGVRAGARTVSTQDGIKQALVHDGVECAIVVVHAADIHLLERHGGVLLVLAQLLHLLNGNEGLVDVLDVMKAIVEHFFAQTCVHNLSDQKFS